MSPGLSVEAAVAGPRLLGRRLLQAGAGQQSDGAAALGGREYVGREVVDRAAPRLLAVGLDASSASRAAWCADLWLTRAAVRRHTVGCVDYAADGDWVFGTARIDDRAAPGGLAAATERAYHDVFTVLEREATPHLVRLWNYLAAINEPGLSAAGDAESEQAALERYRLFNLGRQRAFLASRRDAFQDAPAACALGSDAGPLTVHFLAGRSRPRPVENPRQVSAYRYPPRYGPRSPTFSRAVLADLDERHEGLFISGTASIVGHETRHLGDAARQAEETLANIDAVLEAGNALARARHRAEGLDYTIYLRREDDFAAVAGAFRARFGTGSDTVARTICLRADICRAELLVEIEAQGWAPWAR